jgi:oligopeptide transport system substrate-binding protein
MINRRLIGASLACALLSVSALAVATPAAAQVIYNRGQEADPETLDPQKISTAAEFHIMRDLYETLVIHDGQGKVAPGVAERWSMADDGKSYRFTLRANARWSNGDPVKASDFVFAWRRAADPATGAKYNNLLDPVVGFEAVRKGTAGAKLEEIGITAVDDRTVEVRLTQPTPYFIELLTLPISAPLHEASVRQHGGNFVRPENKVSNGAYRLRDFTPGAQASFVKNPHFHDAANVKIDQVNFIPLADSAAAARRFQAGEILSTVNIPANQIKALRQQLGNQVQVTPLLGTWYLTFNNDKAPFNDRRVRTALSMVLDREFIAEQVWNGSMLPAYSFVPPGINNYGKPQELRFKDQSVIEREEAAKKLLAEAGFGPNNPLRVEYRFNMSPENQATFVAIADQWKQIGVVTTPINTDGRTHFAFLRDRGVYDVARAGWIADYNDPQNFLFLLETSAIPGLNYARWSNAQYDDLMKRAAAEVDLTKRAEIMGQAERLLLDEAPYTPVLYFTNRNLISPRLVGFTPNARGSNPTRFMSIRN